MKTPLYNTAHPLAESGKPIFIPFGEWNYDGQHRQRLDRAHGERIANELNARVAKGDPGIPVYQGHPDVPALASKYPDKGALGWVVKIEIVNECCQCGNVAKTNSNSQLGNGNIGTGNTGNIKPGLALTVEWDRDPGRGFRWFSPYWLANSREGSTYIVDEIASIGLVNNPNIPEFRLANEERPVEKKLNPAIIELAAKYDRLANEANFDESKHPRASDGKFSSGGGGGSGGSSGGDDVVIVDGDDGDINDLIGGSLPELTHEQRARGEATVELRKSKDYLTASAERKAQMLDAETKRTLRKKLYTSLEKKVGTGAAVEIFRATGLSDLEIHGDPAKVERAAHRAAILSGLKYNRSTHQYEERDRLANEANFDESKHPRAEDGKFSSGGGGGGKPADETQSGGGTSYREKQIAARQADVDSAQKAFDEAKAALIAGQKRGWSKEEDDKAFKVYDRAERKLAFAKRELRSAIGAPPISRAEQMRRDTKDVFHGNASQATRARLIAELAARFNSARKA